MLAALEAVSKVLSTAFIAAVVSKVAKPITVATPVEVIDTSPDTGCDCQEPSFAVPMSSEPAAVGSGTVPDIGTHARAPLPLSLRNELASPKAEGQVYVGAPSFVTPLVISSVGDFEYPSTVIAPVITTGFAAPAPPVWTAKTGDMVRQKNAKNPKRYFTHQLLIASIVTPNSMLIILYNGIHGCQ